MKRKFLFDIFVDKGLKIKFLLLKLNIAPFNNSQSNMINLMRQIPRGRKYVNNNLWCKYLCEIPVSAVNNGICKGIYATIRLTPL